MAGEKDIIIPAYTDTELTVKAISKEGLNVWEKGQPLTSKNVIVEFIKPADGQTGHYLNDIAIKINNGTFDYTNPLHRKIYDNFETYFLGVVLAEMPLYSSSAYDRIKFTVNANNILRIDVRSRKTNKWIEYSLGTGSYSISSNGIIDIYANDFFIDDYAYGSFGSKTIASISYISKTMSFVVSDKLSDYPNGSVHSDGFWYSLLATVPSSNVQNLSDTALNDVETSFLTDITKRLAVTPY